MVGDILPQDAREPWIRNLLEVEKGVVESRDSIDCAETAVKVTVEALRRSWRGYDERATRRRGRRP